MTATNAELHIDLDLTDIPAEQLEDVVVAWLLAFLDDGET